MNPSYINPDKNILAKIGLKEVGSSDNEFKEFKGNLFKEGSHITLQMEFHKGVISITEYHRLRTDNTGKNFKVHEQVRLFRIHVNNDDELEIILRQTFPIAYLIMEYFPTPL